MRIIEIVSCVNCPYLITSHLAADNWYCSHAKKYFTREENIPGFCSLEKVGNTVVVNGKIMTVAEFRKKKGKKRNKYRSGVAIYGKPQK